MRSWTAEATKGERWKRGTTTQKLLLGSLDSCLVIWFLWFVLVRKGGIPDEQLSFSKWYFPAALKVSNLVDVTSGSSFSGCFEFPIKSTDWILDWPINARVWVCIELLNYQPVTIGTCTWIHGCVTSSIHVNSNGNGIDLFVVEPAIQRYCVLLEFMNVIQGLLKLGIILLLCVDGQPTLNGRADDRDTHQTQLTRYPYRYVWNCNRDNKC